MTTREYLRARVFRLYRYIFPFVLVLLATTIWAEHSLVFSSVVLAVITACVAGYTVFMRRTPCLRCSAPLKNAALNWGSKHRPAPCCANCGLGIDDQVGDP
jgi:hypothetical protein